MNKITVRVPEMRLADVDALVADDVFPNRSEAFRLGLRAVVNAYDADQYRRQQAYQSSEEIDAARLRDIYAAVLEITASTPRGFAAKSRALSDLEQLDDAIASRESISVPEVSR